MKKEYFKPEMQVYEVGTQQLLAGSPGYNEDKLPEDDNPDMY